MTSKKLAKNSSKNKLASPSDFSKQSCNVATSGSFEPVAVGVITLFDGATALMSPSMPLPL